MNLDLSSDRGQDGHAHVIYALLYYKKCYWCVLGISRRDGFVVTCGTGSAFEVARGATGVCGVVTVTTLLFTVNIIQACRRGGGVVILMAFSSPVAWWRHQMETFSALLAICAGNSPASGEFPAQRPVTRNFDVFFDLRLNKHSWGWWFETLLCLLWRQCYGSEGFNYENLQCGRRRELSLVTRGLRLSKQPLSFWWDHTYCYLNSYPFILWNLYFVANSMCISFQICLL